MTTINFDMPFAFTARVRGRDVVLDLDKLSAASFRPVFEYGLQRRLNDSTGAVKRDDFDSDDAWRDACVGQAMKTWDALVKGEKAARAPRRAGDPVMAIALDMAIGVLRARPGVKIAKLDKAKVAAWAREYVERNPELMDRARAQHEAALAADDVDIDALMGDESGDETTTELAA